MNKTEFISTYKNYLAQAENEVYPILNTNDINHTATYTNTTSSNPTNTSSAPSTTSSTTANTTIPTISTNSINHIKDKLDLLVSKHQLSHLAPDATALIHNVHQYILHTCQFLHLNNSLQTIENASKLCYPLSLLSDIDKRVNQLKLLSPELWKSEILAPSNLYIHKNIKKFVKVFNQELGNRDQNKIEAHTLIDSLITKAWATPGVLNIDKICLTRHALILLFKCEDFNVKFRALDALLEILESDPIQIESAYNLVHLQQQLLEEINTSKSQMLNTELQRKLIKVYAISLECILLHANSDHLNGLTEEVKRQIWDGAKALKDSNVLNDTEIHFWTEYAIEGAVRIKTEISTTDRLLARAISLAKVGIFIGMMVRGSEGGLDLFRSVISELEEAFSYIHFEKKWFEELLVIRKISRFTSGDYEKFRYILNLFQKRKRGSSSFNILYGIISTLEHITLTSPCKYVQEEAFKLIIQQLTTDNKEVLRKIIYSFINMLSNSDTLKNTAYATLQLIQSCQIIPKEEFWKKINLLPDFIKAKENFKIDNVFQSVIKFVIRRLGEIKGEKDYGGQSFITLACSATNPAMIRPLLTTLKKLSPNLNGHDNYGRTPYHIAVLDQNITIIQYIHEILSIDVNAQEFNKQNTALHLACKKRLKCLMKLLLEFGADPNIDNSDGEKPIHIAVKTGYLSLVELLIENGAKLTTQNIYGETPLNIAIKNDNVPLVEFLISSGAKIAEEIHRLTPIIVAARNNSEKTLRYLLETNRAPLTDLEALEIASKPYDNGGLISPYREFFIEHLEKFNDTPKLFELNEIHQCIAYNDKKKLKKILKTANPEIINKPEILGFTPLHFAAYLQNEKMMKLLIKHGAHLNVKNDFGDTPFLILCGNHNKRTPISINSLPDRERFSIKKIKNASILDELITAGTDPFAQDLQKNNALHHAIISGEKFVINYLIKRYPNLLWQRNIRGLLPLEEGVVRKKSLDFEPFIENETISNPQNELIGQTNFNTLSENKALSTLDNELIGQTNINTLSENETFLNLHKKFVEQTNNTLTLGNFLVVCCKPEAFEQMISEEPSLALHADSTPRKKTPLNIAAKTGNVAILDIYKRHNLSMNTLDNFNNHPLHIAVLYHQHTFLKALLDLNISPLQRNNDGRTPLHLAALKNDIDSISILSKFPELLLENDDNGWLPLHLASRDNQFDAVELLSQLNPHTVFTSDDDLQTPLHLAAIGGYVPIIEILMKNNSFIEAKNIYGETPLILAAYHGNCEAVITLLNYGADIQAKDLEGETALHKAVFKEQSEVVSILLNVDRKLERLEEKQLFKLKNIYNESPLHLLGKVPAYTTTSSNHKIEIMKNLLRAGASVFDKDENGETFLHILCTRGAYSVLKAFTTTQPTIKLISIAPDDNGDTLIHKGAKGGHNLVVQFLLDHGFHLNEKNKNGETPLLCAVIKGHLNLAKQILLRGVDPNTHDLNQKYLLHHLLTRQYFDENHLEFLIWILERYPKLVWKTDNEGMSVLHYLAEFNLGGILDIILSKVDSTKRRDYIALKNKNGLTAHQVARNNGFDDLEKWIRNYPK